MRELWEVERDKDNGRDCWNVCEGDDVLFTCYSAFIADRVALEHNVFRSMSDEQIKELATNMVTYYALRAELNEAVNHTLNARKLVSEAFMTMPIKGRESVYLKMTRFLNQTQKIYEAKHKETP